MSYDVNLRGPEVDDVCCECRQAVKRRPNLYSWNYTSNVAPMWRKAGADLKAFDGKTAGECAPVLAAAIERMEAEPDVYRAMDSPNGWGTYDRLLPRLRELLREMLENSSATVEVCW
jgi:hypothetical protein